MDGLMTAPMVLIELVIVRLMYQNPTANVAVAIAAILVLALCWFGIPQQWGVDDRQFLRSMIPLHAGAILIYEHAPLQRAEFNALRTEIIRRQQAEMKALLASQ